VNSLGHVYVTDAANYRIQKFDSAGNFMRTWGTEGSGNGQFQAPSGIAVDALGHVYVADEVNDDIQEFSCMGDFITSWGSAGSSNGQFNSPEGVGVDSSGYVYVPDYKNDNIQKFDSAGNFMTSWGSEGSGNGQFQHPACAAVDSSENVYVTDVANYRVQKFGSAGNFIKYWGSKGSQNGEFTYAAGIAVDLLGYVYVTDGDNNRIQQFTNEGGYKQGWGSEGSGNGQFNGVIGIAVDSSSNVYVTDYYNNRIQKCSPPCTFPLSPNSYAYNSPSQSGTISVLPSNPACGWNASTVEPWITITGSTQDTKTQTNNKVNYTVAANATGSGRKGMIVIGGQLGVQGFTVRQAGSTFTDVPENTFTPYIYAIYAENITTGCGSGMYCPSTNVTRGQMAAFIIRSLYGENFTYTATPYFSDVPSSNAFFKYVQKLKDLGITTTTGAYMVGDTVTRDQMAAFIIRPLYGETFTYTETPYYTDVPSTSVFFKYIQKMKDLGITTTTGTYMASSDVTRDQMAAFLARAFLGMQ
jgi:streptogramin lyase